MSGVRSMTARVGKVLLTKVIAHTITQNEHTAEEKAMILRRYPRYKDDMIQLWNSLRKSGYNRSYTSLVRVVNKWIKPEIKAKKTRKPQPYQRSEYPGQKVQIDVKFVPSYCVSNGLKYYQYTAVDECSRWVYREMYDEHKIIEYFNIYCGLRKIATHKCEFF